MSMTKAQRREHKAGIKRRREVILATSFKKPKGSNWCVYLGGVGQAGKFSTK